MSSNPPSYPLLSGELELGCYGCVRSKRCPLHPITEPIPFSGICAGIREASSKNGRKGDPCGIRCSNHSRPIQYDEDTGLWPWMLNPLTVFPFLRGISFPHSCIKHEQDIRNSIVDDHIHRLATPEQITSAIHAIQIRCETTWGRYQYYLSKSNQFCSVWNERFLHWGVDSIPKWADISHNRGMAIKPQ